MADTLSRTLGPPTAWTEELCARRNPDLSGADSAYEGHIVLSYSLKKLERWNVNLDAVKADFENGLRIRSGHPHRAGRRFWLEGDQYEAEILSKRADRNGQPIAFVLNLALASANTVPRRAGRIAYPVRFENVYEEWYCDLEAVYEHVQPVERYPAARASADRAVRSARPDVRLSRHGELHGLARKRYGALRGLLSLLALRAERSAATAVGVAISADGDDASDSLYLHVQISEHDRPLSEFNDAQVELSPGQARTRTRNLSGRIITLDMPERGNWIPGTNVTLSTVPRFSMKQHDKALDRFLRGEVEGDWDDLAALLCKPVLLDLESRPLPPRFFCDEDPEEDPLDDAQRQAVAGALTTPHSFVIQGPPGTGKTTVICEIARQLIARKQRVLLLAPQHVAVDEVLRRIGRKSGVRALRLSWEETRVDERTRDFLPDRVGKEFVGALRRPGPDSDAHWEARHRGLIAERDALERVLNARQKRGQAENALADAQVAQAEAQRRLEEARAWQERDSQQRQREIAEADLALSQARQAAEHAAWAADHAWVEFGSASPPVDALATELDGMADAEEKLAQAMAAKLAAEREHAHYQEKWTRELDYAARALAATEEPWYRASSATATSYQQLQIATTRLAELSGRDGLGQRLLDQIGIGARARRQSKVDQARQEWVNFDRERQRWEVERHRWIAEQNRLNADAIPHHHAAHVLNANERLVAAKQDRQRASVRWQEAGRAAHGETWAEPRRPAAAATALRAALHQPATTPPLPAELAPVQFRRAHDRLRAALAVVGRQSAAQGTAQDVFLAAEQSFREASESGQVELERLGAEESSAATYVRGCHAALEQAAREVSDSMMALGYAEHLDHTELAVQHERLNRKIRVLPRYAELRRRWLQIVEDLSDAQLASDTGDALLRSVNLVCATTTGIAGRSADSVRRVDFDTLIVDEASRVIDSEFLIGAVRARRWILVGDEHQLPPYVEQADEYHLHALAALYRHERGDADSLEESVRHLAKLWQEDEEQRQFREETVLQQAVELRTRGEWPGDYLDAFAEARQYFAGADPDREFLRAMRDHLVKSLLERVTANSRRSLREPLIVQRRMIEPMARIVQGPVYRGQYRTAPTRDLRRCGVSPLVTQTFDRPIVFLDTSAGGREEHHGHGFINKLESDWIANACRIYERELTEPREVSVSILCFYLAQALAIRRRLNAPRYPGFRRLTFDRIDPIDKIQGQQSDLVFVSFCRSNPHPSKNFGLWLQDLRRLNVACTRARRALVLVGHREMLSKLHTFTGAQSFYKNLFDLFDTSPDHFLHLEDF